MTLRAKAQNNIGILGLFGTQFSSWLYLSHILSCPLKTENQFVPDSADVSDLWGVILRAHLKGGRSAVFSELMDVRG